MNERGDDIDVRTLEVQLTDLVTQLQKLIERDRLSDLIPIWKRPGWTTPAEFAFMTASLEGIGEHVNALEKTIERAVGAAELVQPA